MDDKNYLSDDEEIMSDSKGGSGDWATLHDRVEELAQGVHDARRYLDDQDLFTDGDLPGMLAAAANTLDWAVDLCDDPSGSDVGEAVDRPLETGRRKESGTSLDAAVTARIALEQLEAIQLWASVRGAARAHSKASRIVSYVHDLVDLIQGGA